MSDVIQKIFEWNDIASVVPNEESRNLYHKLVLEEFTEMFTGVLTGEPYEIVDALCDSIWVACGLARAVGAAHTDLSFGKFARYNSMYGHDSVAEIVSDLVLPSFIDENLNKHKLLVDIDAYVNFCYQNLRFCVASMVSARPEDMDKYADIALKEVERSNYSKFVVNTDGTFTCIKREDGKIMKPESFSPVDFEKALGL